MLSLLFVMGCKDTVTPSDPLVPQVPAGGGSTEIPPGEDDDNNHPETPYPGPQKPSAAIFHDETCTCGGTITLKDYSEGGIVVTCTGNHSLDGGAGNAPGKAMVCYTIDAADEGPYVVSFEAKADSVYDSVVNVHNTEENLNLCSYIPISYTTEYKKYNYIVYINDNVRGENTFGFSVNNGKTYIKNLTIENTWHEDTEWVESEMSAWKIWQDPSCNPLNVGASNAGHISIYEMTKDSVKAIRNTCQMEVPEGWKHQVVYYLSATSAGKYCMSFTNKSYSKFENGVIGNILIQYWDEVKQCNISIPSVTGITGQGKYYFYFDIPEEYNNKPFEAFFVAKNYGAWLEEYIILEDIKVEKVTEEVEIEGAKKLISYKSETIDISDDWSIKYENWSYGDVICSNVTESSIGITVPEEDFANELWPWVQVIRKPITLNPGETYFVSADYVSNYDGFVGFSLWNSTDNIYVSTMPLDGGMCYTNTSNSSKQYFVYSHLEPGCIHIISNFKETILSPTPIWKDWSYLFVGEDDFFEALSVSNNGISFNIEDDFDLCAVDLALDLEVGKEYEVNFDITGPNSEILIGSMLYTNGNTSESYKADSFYLYDNRTDNFSDYIYVTDDCTGKGVLRFHPQVPGTYTISDIEVITVGSE